MEQNAVKPRDRFFNLLNKWLQIKAKYYEAKKARKLVKNSQQSELTNKTDMSTITAKTFTIANTIDKVRPHVPRLDYTTTTFM